MFLQPEYYQTAMTTTATALPIPCAARAGVVLNAVIAVVRSLSEVKTAAIEVGLTHITDGRDCRFQDVAINACYSCAS